MTVGELLARTSSRELAEWMAYYSIEPFGPLAEDRRHGSAMAMQANIHRDSKGRTYEARDFMMTKIDRPTQDPIAQMHVFKALEAAR